MSLITYIIKCNNKLKQANKYFRRKQRKLKALGFCLFGERVKRSNMHMAVHCGKTNARKRSSITVLKLPVSLLGGC